jgi:hypothetical protein
MASYKIGLRNKQALCVTIPNKMAEAKGFVKSVKIEWVDVPEGLLMKKAELAPVVVATQA